jgi:hypothetical protein
MDLNELLYHHQMALMAVGRAQRDGRSTVNFDLPCYYARRINEYRERRGLTFDIPEWCGGPANRAKAQSSPFVGDLLGAQPRVPKP